VAVKCALGGVVAGLIVIGLSSTRALAVDPRNFDPAASNAAILGLDTSWVAPSWTPFVNLTATYVNDELVDRSGELGPILDERVVTTLGLGLAMFDRLELGVSLPFHVTSTTDGNATGIGDLRAQAKLRLVGPEHGGGGFGLALTLGATFATGGAAPFSSDDGVGLDPRVVLDYRAGSGAVIVLSAGYRHRPEAEVFGLAIGDEIRFGLGGELPFVTLGASAPLSLLAEVEGAVGLAGDDPASEQQRVIEARLGLRLRSARWSATLASGTGFSNGYGTPDFRVVLGVAWGASPIAEPTTVLVAAPVDPEPEFAPVAPLDEVAAVDDPDADADGVPTARDKCPTEPEDHDGFEDEDGCPEPDNDVDGVLDANDKCPDEKEVVNGYRDDDGCADEVPPSADGKDPHGPGTSAAGGGPAIRPDGQIELPGPIAFRSGSDVLLAQASPYLAQVATFLTAHPEVKRLRIEGHTDDQGDKEFNVDLSERRAARVRMALVERGVDASRLLPKGFGPTRPLVPNTNDKNRAQNRRVEMRVVDGPTVTPEDQP